MTEEAFADFDLGDDESDEPQLHPAFVTLSELASREYPPARFIAWPFAPEDAFTLLSADAKIGKTTYLLELCRAVGTGADFLGHETIWTPIVYLTEQTEHMFQLQARECPGLDLLDTVYVVSHGHPSARSFSWQEWLQLGGDTCVKVGARLLVIDTARAFISGSGGVEDSNSEDAVMAALARMDELKQAGIAVLLVRHTRKAGGTPTQASSGSGAWVSTPDHIVHMSAVSRYQRKVTAKGRLLDGNVSIVVEWIRGKGLVVLDKDAADDAPPPAPKRDDAESVLGDRLAEGAVLTADLKHAGEEAGISEGTYKRARAKLGIEERWIDGKRWSGFAEQLDAIDPQRSLVDDDEDVPF